MRADGDSGRRKKGQIRKNVNNHRDIAREKCASSKYGGWGSEKGGHREGQGEVHWGPQ